MEKVMCSHYLKTLPFTNWLEANHPERDCIIYYGFGTGELHRMQRRSSILGAMGYKTEYPLFRWRRTISTTRSIGIEPPSTYGVWKHANCQGCMKSGRQHWYVVYCLRPDIFAEGLATEEEVGFPIIQGTFLSDLVPLFAQMQAAGVVPTEKPTQQRFWADVKRLLGSDILLPAAEETPELPCECIA